MKSQLLFIALLFSIPTFAQHAKKVVRDREAESSVKDSTKYGSKTGLAPVQFKPPAAYALVLTGEQWQYLFKIVRTSGKLTAVQADDYIEAINASLKPITDSTAKK